MGEWRQRATMRVQPEKRKLIAEPEERPREAQRRIDAAWMKCVMKGDEIMREEARLIKEAQEARRIRDAIKQRYRHQDTDAEWAEPNNPEWMAMWEKTEIGRGVVARRNAARVIKDEGSRKKAMGPVLVLMNDDLEPYYLGTIRGVSGEIWNEIAHFRRSLSEFDEDKAKEAAKRCVKLRTATPADMHIKLIMKRLE